MFKDGLNFKSINFNNGIEGAVIERTSIPSTNYDDVYASMSSSQLHSEMEELRNKMSTIQKIMDSKACTIESLFDSNGMMIESKLANYMKSM